MGYWDETDQYMRRHGRGPTCPRCGAEMFPQDDHGRFTCLCSLSGGLDVVTGMRLHMPEISQAEAGTSDKEKAKVPPTNQPKS